MPELQISKLDAAKRQLEMAIVLYFHEADPVSIHTLTAAAYNIIRDINSKRGGLPMYVKGLFFSIIKEEYRQEIITKIQEAENFFKHADKDPDGVLKFDPTRTEILILDACMKYYELTGEKVPSHVVFQGWYAMENPESYSLPPEMDAFIREQEKKFAHRGRLWFFSNLLPVAAGLFSDLIPEHSPRQ
jgi:hypothetical protein